MFCPPEPTRTRDGPTLTARLGCETGTGPHDDCSGNLWCWPYYITWTVRDRTQHFNSCTFIAPEGGYCAGGPLNSMFVRCRLSSARRPLVFWDHFLGHVNPYLVPTSAFVLGCCWVILFSKTWTHLWRTNLKDFYHQNRLKISWIQGYELRLRFQNEFFLYNYWCLKMGHNL